MAWKILLGSLLLVSILLSSCYPELSVQQYDQLKEDLAELDVQRQELMAELSTIKEKDTETFAYVVFLERLASTQISGRILTGEFDVESLINSKTELMSAAENLGDNQIVSYLESMDSENEDSQTVAAYYKVVEYCLKKMKHNLQ